MAEKLDMKSMNITEDNVKKIQALFPNVVTEIMDEDGKFKLAIDFDALKQELSNDLINEKQERYQMTWPDKSKAKLLANSRISATLRPDKEKSVNFDTTKNLYIEGDNLDVLKLLRETYLGKIKMIYIDPPYNTGNDFVYEDDFDIDADEYKGISGDFDEQGNRLVQNTEGHGRFHTKWLNMIYPRIKIARDLLNDSGVIFISIDENEIENLRKVCDEVFGEHNFVAQFIWRGGRRNLAKYVSTSHEYMLCFAKNLQYISDNGISWDEKKKGLSEIYKKANQLVIECKYDYELASKKLKEWYRSLPDDDESKANSHYSCIDERGVYFPSDISRGGGKGPQWKIKNPKTGNYVQTPSRGWSYAKIEDLEKDIADGYVHFNGDGVPCKKRYLKDNETQVLETVFYRDRRGSSKRLRNLMEGDYFPFPKDEEVLAHYIRSFADKDSIILDFFSGSATTAHSVMQLNAEDGGNRKFIMVQLPEKCEEKSEAYKAGYKTICEIGKERIRRAGKKIVEETGKDIDIGFRVFKLDSSNMNDVYYNPNAFNQSMLDMTVDNVKADRTPLDLLFQVMLDLGVELSADIVEKTVNGKKIYAVNGNDLIACFDNDIDNDVITSIATEKPLYAVFKDKSFATDSVGINNEQLFKTYSPATVVKVI